MCLKSTRALLRVWYFINLVGLGSSGVSWGSLWVFCGPAQVERFMDRGSVFLGCHDWTAADCTVAYEGQLFYDVYFKSQLVVYSRGAENCF